MGYGLRFITLSSFVAWDVGSAAVDVAPAFAVTMDSATAASVYGCRFPVTARSRDDPRRLSWQMVDGKSQALQQLRMAELEAEGRKNKDKPNI